MCEFLYVRMNIHASVLALRRFLCQTHALLSPTMIMCALGSPWLPIVTSFGCCYGDQRMSLSLSDNCEDSENLATGEEWSQASFTTETNVLTPKHPEALSTSQYTKDQETPLIWLSRSKWNCFPVLQLLFHCAQAKLACWAQAESHEHLPNLKQNIYCIAY